MLVYITVCHHTMNGVILVLSLSIIRLQCFDHHGVKRYLFVYLTRTRTTSHIFYLYLKDESLTLLIHFISYHVYSFFVHTSETPFYLSESFIIARYTVRTIRSFSGATGSIKRNAHCRRKRRGTHHGECTRYCTRSLHLHGIICAGLAF